MGFILMLERIKISNMTIMANIAIIATITNSSNIVNPLLLHIHFTPPLSFRFILSIISISTRVQKSIKNKNYIRNVCSYDIISKFKKLEKLSQLFKRIYSCPIIYSIIHRFLRIC